MAEINPYQPPEHDHDDPKPAPPPQPAGTLAWRLAGGCLIANALIVLVERAVVKNASGGMVAPIFDLVIGAALLRGQGKYRAWAIVRCVLGAVVFGAISIGDADYITLGLQLAVTGSLLGLLLGRAGLARTIVASVVFGLYVVVCMIGLVAIGLQGG